MRNRILPYLLLALAVGAVFLPSVQNEFTNWDDNVYVTNNYDIRHVDVPALTRIFSAESRAAAGWTPLVTFSHAIEYQLFSLNPGPYHATNVLIHVAATLVIFALLFRVGVPLPAAFVGALVFGIHPLQVESVVWVSGRKNLLAGLFGFATILLYLRGSKRTYWGAIALFFLACLSKGIAIVIPPLMVATLLLVGRDRSWGREALRLTPFFGLALARGLITVYAQADVWARTAAIPLGERMGIMGGVLPSYLRQFFWPVDLRAFYGWSPASWTDPLPLAGFALVLLLTGLVVWAARRRLWIGYLGAFIPITMFPMLNLFPSPFFQADRYVYMSLPAAGALVAVAVYALAERLRRAWIAPTLLALWCGLVLTPTTLHLTKAWKDSYSLWTRTLHYEPNWTVALNNLGLWYQNKEGDLETALSYLEQALALKPKFVEARVNLGFLYEKLDRPEEAEAEFRSLLADSPDRWRVYSGLGAVIQKQGRIREAEALYRKALEMEPRSAEVLSNLGALFYELGHFGQAVAYYDQALRLEPLGSSAYNNRGNALRMLGRLDEAAMDLKQSIELDPDYAAAYSNLGAVHVDAGRPAEAIPMFEKALELDPELESAESNLGNAYFAMGKYEEALGAYGRALELNPDFPEALSNSANSLTVLGRHEEAQARYRRALEIRPSFPEAKHGLGRSLLFTGHPKEALPLLREAHQALPGFVEGAWYLGQAAQETGDLELAAQSYAHVIQLQPGRLQAYPVLARLLVQLDRPETAELVLRKAISLAEAPALLDQLAELLERNPSRREEAEGLRARARSLTSKYGETASTTTWLGAPPPAPR